MFQGSEIEMVFALIALVLFPYLVFSQKGTNNHKWVAILLLSDMAILIVSTVVTTLGNDGINFANGWFVIRLFAAGFFVLTGSIAASYGLKATNNTNDILLRKEHLSYHFLLIRRFVVPSFLVFIITFFF